MQLDTTTEFGARVARRLAQDGIIWLVTVRHDGTPQPSPVWFHWDGESALIYSQPRAPKLRNIARNPRVALHFDANASGGDVVVLTGEARVLPDAPLARDVPAFVGKYVDRLRAVQSMEDFARTMDGYDVALRVTPGGVRGF